MSRKTGFTLVEIMIVVAIIGLLAAIAIPAFMRARDNARKSACINNLRQIDGAKDQYAVEQGGTNGMSFDDAAGGATNAGWNLLCPYIKDLSNKVFCAAALLPARGTTNYTLNVLGVDPVCLIIGSAGGHCLTNQK